MHKSPEKKVSPFQADIGEPHNTREKTDAKHLLTALSMHPVHPVLSDFSFAGVQSCGTLHDVL